MNTIALLVMDVQRGIVDRYSQDAGYLARLRRAVDAARAVGIRPIYVTVRFRQGYPEISARNKGFRAVTETGRLDRKETAGEVATDVATGISKSLPRKVGASGFEPPTSWSRTRRANRAALRPELLDAQTLRRSDAQTHSATPRPSLCVCCVCRVCASSLMRPGGLEPPASWSVAKRSIQLSYGRHSFPAGIESTDGQTVR